MRFKYWTDAKNTYIEAIFDDDDNLVGNREEGPGVEIEIEERKLVFDYPVKNIHPDILGLICMLNFFPFVGSRVEFPEPVSPRLEKAFQRTPFTNKKIIKFVNVDNSIPKYKGSTISIAFGGGVDSSAVREMFPEAFLIHEAHIKDGRLLHYYSHDIVEKIGKDRAALVATNQRYVSNPGGWHSWPCSMVTSLLMATDRDIGIILCGSVMGSNYLWNGAKYYDRPASREFQGFSGNYWQSVFHDIGIPLFSPIDGISEYGSMSVTIELIKAGEVVYCMGDKGEACNRCTKCFRREVIRTCVQSDFIPNWDYYNTEMIHDFLENRPLYFGHIFSYARKSGKLPEWVTSRISDVQKIDTDWPLKYYSKALEFCPVGWEETIIQRIKNFFEIMTEEEEEELINWDQEKNNSRLS